MVGNLHPRPLLVLYDGTSRFCAAGVARLVRADAHHRFECAPLHGETAAELYAGRAPENVDGIVLVVRDTSIWPYVHFHGQSRAVLLIAGHLPFPWVALSWLGILPRPLTDLGYRLILRIGNRLWGRRALP